MTLRWRLTIAFAFVVLVPLVVGAVVVVRLLPQVRERQQELGLAGSARVAALTLQGFCDRAHDAAVLAGRSIRTPAQAAQLVGAGVADGLRVTDPAGATVASAGVVPPAPDDCATGAGASSGPAVAAVVRLSTRQGQRAGTVTAVLQLRPAVLAGLADSVRNADVALLDGAGRVVASSRPVRAEVVAAARARPAGATVQGVATAIAPAGARSPYGVLLVQPLARPRPRMLLGVAAVGAGALLVAGVIALLLARATVRPLEELGAAVRRISAGDLSTEIEVRSRDEIGRLSTAFNAMTGTLRAYVGQLRASRDELAAAIARLGDTLSATHDLDRILAVVLESSMAATGARSGMVLLMNPDRDRLTLAALRGREVPLGLALGLSEGVSGRVAADGEPLTGWLGQDGLVPAAGEPGQGSVIAVPLKSGGTVIGVLDLFDAADPGGFGPEDVGTIRTFAGQATVAVDNVLLHEEAQRLSVTDGLTGLWNFRYFTLTAAKEIERATRFDRPLALLMLDLDHFKSVNDTYGHQRGDAVLVELASRVRGAVRDVDTVARYGGEEVVVLLPETDEAGAAQAAARLCELVRRRRFGRAGESPIGVTVSVGVAVFPLHAAGATTLLREADAALYVAKEQGRDTWRMAGQVSDTGAGAVGSGGAAPH